MQNLPYGRALRQTIWLTAAALAHVVGVASLALYLSLPDVRPLANRLPETTAYMRMRAADPATPPIRRQPVSLERIDSMLVRAVWVSEDASFYLHRGVDWYELRQALLDALRGSGSLRGASTLTQQLARNLYLSPERSVGRKLVELFIARRLERELTKRRTLELYLNVVEWGRGIFGAEAAARHYYSVPAAALSPRQAAELAATLPHPLTANPATRSEQLEWRTALILERLRAFGWLAAEPSPLDTLALLDSLGLRDTLTLRDTLLLHLDSVAPFEVLTAPDAVVSADTVVLPDTVAPDTAVQPESAIPDTAPPDTASS